MQCRDRVIKCRNNTSAFRLLLCCDIHFLCCNIFLILLLILCRDNLLTVILNFALSLSLLRHSSSCCDKLLQVALGFCRNNDVIMSRHNYISALAILFYFFLLFLLVFVSFA